MFFLLIGPSRAVCSSTRVDQESVNNQQGRGVLDIEDWHLDCCPAAGRNNWVAPIAPRFETKEPFKHKQRPKAHGAFTKADCIAFTRTTGSGLQVVAAVIAPRLWRSSVSLRAGQKGRGSSRGYPNRSA